MKTLLTYFAACAMAAAGSLKPGDAVKPDAIGATTEVVTDLLAGGEKEAAIVKEKQEAAAKEVEEEAKAEAESAARRERLGDFEEQLNKLGQANDHEGALKLVKKTLAENTKLAAEDKQQLTFVMAMIYAEMKKLDEALKALDKAKAIAPESELGKHVEEIKEQVKQHLTEEEPPEE